MYVIVSALLLMWAPAKVNVVRMHLLLTIAYLQYYYRYAAKGEEELVWKDCVWLRLSLRPKQFQNVDVLVLIFLNDDDMICAWVSSNPLTEKNQNLILVIIKKPSMIMMMTILIIDNRNVHLKTSRFKTFCVMRIFI